MTTYAPHVEPVWPLIAVTSVAALVTALTVWTYQGVDAAKGGRWWALLALRLAALGVACLILVRPTWEYREGNVTTPVLVLLVDGSKSMVVKDEEPNLTRWEALLRDWNEARDLIQQLEDEGRIRVATYQFDQQLREPQLDQAPLGERTALLQALDQAYEHHKPFDPKGTPLLGVVLMSDGRDNVGKPALEALVAKFARAPCPIHTIGLGHPGGSEFQPDLIAQSIETPQTARVKDKLLVRGAIQAQRFLNQEVEVWLKIDGETVDQADNPGEKVRVVVKPTQANQTLRIELPAARLPDKPGDVRVSLWVKPQQGELTDSNNEASSYLTLLKEGLSVLYFDKDRAWEPKFLRRALKGDQRITLYGASLGSDDGPEAEAWRSELLDSLRRTSYDVFIFGDVPASRFAPQSVTGAAILEEIEKAVNRGAGLLMLGGQESFGEGKEGTGRGGWQNTPLAALLPVELNTRGQLEGPAGGQRDVKFVPTDAGLRHFTLLLASDPQKNRTWWEQLHPLDGGNRLGTRKQGATELARSPEGDLLLAWQQYGKGRTMALAVDTTWRWARPGPPMDPRDANKPGALSAGREAHLRFWRQMILWLARQEEAGKSVRIELDQRRLAAGKEQGITVQAREVAPGGNEDAVKAVTDAVFDVQIIKPDKTTTALPVTPQGGPDGKSRGVFWKTDDPGEYEVVVTARQQGTDLGKAHARFMTYRDDSELVNRTANHVLLERLAKTTGGTYRLHGGLRSLLEEMQPQAIRETTKLFKIPNWDEPNPLLQGLLFLLFVGLLCGEWLCRRLWGLT